MKKQMLNANLGLAGYYRLEAKRPDGSRREVMGWTKNLITNNGLNLLSNSDFSQSLRQAFVSSDNAEPAVTDSQIDNVLGSTLDRSAVSSGVDAVERYLFYRVEFEFGQGDAAGNISKIAIGATGAPNNIFSISLVKDDQGNPITRTVQQNEFLTLTYELRVSQPTEDFIYNIDGRSIVLRSALINNSDYWSGRAMRASGTNQRCWASPQNIQTLESFPQFPSSSDATSVTNDSYTPLSFTRTASIFFDISKANFVIQSFCIQFGPGQWQFSVDPPINKQNTDELTVVVRLTWAREGELPS